MTQDEGDQAPRTGPPGGYLVAQVALGIALLGVWEWAGATTSSHWVNRPGLIAARLADWFAGEIYIHLWSTTAELLSGLVIGTTLGILAGLVLGRAVRLGASCGRSSSDSTAFRW